MIQQDYILRMIEQMGALLRALLHGSGSRDQLEGQLDEMALECIGLPLVALLSLSEEEAFRLIRDSERLVPEKAYMLGEICRAKGLSSEEATAREDLARRARYFFAQAQGQVGGEIEAQIARRLAEGAGLGPHRND